MLPISVTTVLEIVQAALAVAPDVEKLIASIEKVVADYKAEKAKIG
jgi:hypothetical protein